DVLGARGDDRERVGRPDPAGRNAIRKAGRESGCRNRLDEGESRVADRSGRDDVGPDRRDGRTGREIDDAYGTGAAGVLSVVDRIDDERAAAVARERIVEAARAACRPGDEDHCGAAVGAYRLHVGRRLRCARWADALRGEEDRLAAGRDRTEAHRSAGWHEDV